MSNGSWSRLGSPMAGQTDFFIRGPPHQGRPLSTKRLWPQSTKIRLHHQNIPHPPSPRRPPMSCKMSGQKKGARCQFTCLSFAASIALPSLLQQWLVIAHSSTADHPPRRMPTSLPWTALGLGLYSNVPQYPNFQLDPMRLTGPEVGYTKNPINVPSAVLFCMRQGALWVGTTPSAWD